MFNKKQLFVLNLLLISGGLVALKLLHIDYRINYSPDQYQSFCNINAVFNCDAVAAGPYSHIKGIPIALVGTIANLFLFGFLHIANKRKQIQGFLRPIFIMIFTLYALGCLCLAVITFAFSPSICIMCIIYWVISGSTLIYLCHISRDYLYWTNLVKWFKAIPVIVKGEWPFLSISFALFLVMIFGIKMFYFSHDIVKEQKKVLRQWFHPYIGLDNAPLELVIYSDFQCPSCRKVHTYFEKLADKYGDKIKFVRKEFPLDKSCNRKRKYPLHEFACRTAYYAKCAGNQGHFWDYHNKIYENQEELTDELLQKLAQDLFLNKRQLVNCVESSVIHNAVNIEIEEGIYFGIDGTPSMRIFGEIFTPMIKEEILKEYINNYPEMTPSMLKRYYDKQFNKFIQIIDLRPKNLYKVSHIQGAISWPLFQSVLFPQKLDKTKPTIIYDQDGQNVLSAYEILRKNGFTSLMVLKGGFEGWKLVGPHGK